MTNIFTDQFVYRPNKLPTYFIPLRYIIVQTGDNNYEPTINIDERIKENGDETLEEQANKYCKQQNDELELLHETVCDLIHKDSTVII